MNLNLNPRPLGPPLDSGGRRGVMARWTVPRSRCSMAARCEASMAMRCFILMRISLRNWLLKLRT